MPHESTEALLLMHACVWPSSIWRCASYWHWRISTQVNNIRIAHSIILQLPEMRIIVAAIPDMCCPDQMTLSQVSLTYISTASHVKSLIPESSWSCLKGKLSGKQGQKKQKLSGKAADAVEFSELQDKGDRTEAARLFFELLVLQGRKQVSSIQNSEKLAFLARKCKVWDNCLVLCTCKLPLTYASICMNDGLNPSNMPDLRVIYVLALCKTLITTKSGCILLTANKECFVVWSWNGEVENR